MMLLIVVAICCTVTIVLAVLYTDARRKELRGREVSEEQRAQLRRDLARIRATLEGRE